jgi:hypothetical protein
MNAGAPTKVPFSGSPAPRVSPFPTAIPALVPHPSLVSHPSLEGAFSSSAAQEEVVCLDVPQAQEGDSPEVVRLDAPQEQEDDSLEVVRLDVPQAQAQEDDSLEVGRLDAPQEQAQEDDLLEVVRLDVPQEQAQEQEDGSPEVALPDGSPGLREHSALLRWQAARQDVHSAPRCVSQHAWLPVERAWANSPA